jgi:HK97 family phage major capsid protein
MSKTELHEKRGRLVTQAREALDEIKKNTDEARTAELDTRHDTIMGELDRLDAVIAREERTEAAEKRAEEDRRVKNRPNHGDASTRAADEDTNAPEYRMVFAKMISGMSVDELSPEERTVLATGKAEFRAQTAGTTTAGGFTVPTTLADQIVRSMLAWGPMYDPGVCSEILTSSGNPMKLPTVNDTTVAAVAHTEATALTDDGSTDITFGQKALDAYAFDTKFIRWSWELDMDSVFNMETLLGSLLGERLGRIANSQLTTGTGSSAPQGIVGVTTLGVTAASATAIAFDELFDLEHSVDPAYRGSPKAAFMFNDSMLKAVRKLKNGEGDYIWQMGNVQNGVPGTLNGRRYFINQAMASIATGNKAMIFGDLSKYFVRKVGAPVIGVMRERFWPDLGIAGLIRFDGELADTAAVKHLILA